MLTTKEKKLLHQAILKAEKGTTAEIHIAFYNSIKKDVMQDAMEYFQRQGLHKNSQQNDVLIYIVEPARRFAILGDENIHKIVGDKYWQKLKENLSKRFKENKHYEGLLECIKELEIELKRHHPK